MKTVTLKVARKFFEDHRERGCSESAVVERMLAHQVEVTLDRASFDDLSSDADYYAGCFGTGFMDSEYDGLCRSAKAVLSALQKVERSI